MIYKTLYFAALLLVAQAAQASGEVDISGLHSLANESANHPSSFKGSVGFDSSSFLYKSDIRGTSSTTVEATFQDHCDSQALHAQGDLQLYSFVTSNPGFGIEAQELYLQTQKELLGDAQITVGRKLVEWSKLDRTWTMMSLWSPRWTWDELHPELIGMTGVFTTYDTRRFHFVAFGSPLAIPERGTPTTEKDHNLVSPNPFWKPLPSQLAVLGNQVNVRYSLLTPPMGDILLRPNFAVRGRYDFDSGFWVSANTGVLPVNMVQLAAEPYLDSRASGTADLQVNIRPQFPMRNINTVEAGFQESDWDVWASASYEQPFKFDNQPTWLNPIITPSSIISAGTNIKLTQNFSFSGAAIFIHEQPFTHASNLPAVNVQLPSRFPLKQGIKVGGNWKFSELTESNLTWIQDLLEQNHFVSLDAEHLIRKSNLTLGAGTDLLITASNKGWVGQYYGADRLRGWLRYAF